LRAARELAKSARPTPVSMNEMFSFGKNFNSTTLLHSAKFLHNEVPVRIAHSLKQLSTLPLGLSETEPIQHMIRRYATSFDEASSCPHPDDDAGEKRFSEALRNIKRRHEANTFYLSQGLREIKRIHKKDIFYGTELTSSVDKFYLGRIGVRLLIGHHIALSDNNGPKDGFVGIIEEQCNPRKSVDNAIIDASQICEYHYGVAPRVSVTMAEPAHIKYIPSILHHIVFELLKNSMRAVVEKFGEDEVDELGDEADVDPEAGSRISVVISKGSEDLIIKVSDQGGGIPRSGLPYIWSYLYTTAQTPHISDDMGPYRSDGGPPLAGLGYGLPMSRLYARYFSGDLQVVSTDGYGTDAYIFINTIGNQVVVE